MSIISADIFRFELDLPDGTCPSKGQQIDHYVSIWEDYYFCSSIGRPNYELLQAAETPKLQEIRDKFAHAVAHFVWCAWCNDSVFVVKKNATSSDNVRRDYFETKNQEAITIEKYLHNWNTGIELIDEYMCNYSEFLSPFKRLIKPKYYL
jgi:hypothetical protein